MRKLCKCSEEMVSHIYMGGDVVCVLNKMTLEFILRRVVLFLKPNLIYLRLFEDYCFYIFKYKKQEKTKTNT